MKVRLRINVHPCVMKFPGYGPTLTFGTSHTSQPRSSPSRYTSNMGSRSTFIGACHSEPKLPSSCCPKTVSSTSRSFHPVAAASSVSRRGVLARSEDLQRMRSWFSQLYPQVPNESGMPCSGDRFLKRDPMVWLQRGGGGTDAAAYDAVIAWHLRRCRSDLTFSLGHTKPGARDGATLSTPLPFPFAGGCGHSLPAPSYGQAVPGLPDRAAPGLVYAS
jgi:hypothetical protein